MGCLSLQQEEAGDYGPVALTSNSQERIAFTPTPDEIAEIALYHIRRVKAAVVSFGQGCEGDPLMSVDVIEPAIRLIRSKTLEGTINVNTNAGRPEILVSLSTRAWTAYVSASTAFEAVAMKPISDQKAMDLKMLKQALILPLVVAVIRLSIT